MDIIKIYVSIDEDKNLSLISKKKPAKSTGLIVKEIYETDEFEIDDLIDNLTRTLEEDYIVKTKLL